MTQETKKNYTLRIADANPTEIIYLVLEMAETYLDEAIMAKKDDNIEVFNDSLRKASKCINDLIESLDLQYDIAKQLMDIYMFVNREISMAIIKKDSSSMPRVQAMITKLKTSFLELSKQDKSGAVMGNTQGVYAGLTYGKGALNESTEIQSNRGFTV